MDPAVIQLVVAAKAGDREAFASLVEKFRGGVFALAYSYLRDAEEAEDVAQETLVRAYQALGRLESPERFASWLGGIAAHAAVDRIRQRQIEGKLAADPWKVKPPEDIPGPSEEFSEMEEKRRLREAVEEVIQELPEDSRRALLLRVFNDLSYAEIGELTSVPVSTVRGQLYRATRYVRERLGRLGTRKGPFRDPGSSAENE